MKLKYLALTASLCAAFFAACDDSGTSPQDHITTLKELPRTCDEGDTIKLASTDAMFYCKSGDWLEVGLIVHTPQSTDSTTETKDEDIESSESSGDIEGDSGESTSSSSSCTGRRCKTGNSSDSQEGSSDSQEGTSDSQEGSSDSQEGSSDSQEGSSDSHEGSSDSQEGSSDSQEGSSDSQEGSSDSQEGSSDSQEGSSDSQEGSSDSQEGSSDSQEGSSDSQEDPNSSFSMYIPCGDMWCGAAFDYRVYTGLDAIENQGGDFGTGTSGYWFTFNDNGDGGLSFILWPVSLGNEYDDNALDPVIDYCSGLCGTAHLEKGTLSFLKPWVGVGFAIAGASSYSSTTPVSADASDWEGICVVYTSDTDISIEMGLSDEREASILYDYPLHYLNKTQTPKIVNIAWSDFYQSGWAAENGGVEISGNDAAKELVYLKFRIQNSSNDYNFNILSVGTLNSCK